MNIDMAINLIIEETTFEEIEELGEGGVEWCTLRNHIASYQRSCVQKQGILLHREQLSNEFRQVREKGLDSTVTSVDRFESSSESQVATKRFHPLGSASEYHVELPATASIERLVNNNAGTVTPCAAESDVRIFNLSSLISSVSPAAVGTTMIISKMGKPNKYLVDRDFYSLTPRITFVRLKQHCEPQSPWIARLYNWITNEEREEFNIPETSTITARTRILRVSNNADSSVFSEVGIFVVDNLIPSYIIVQYDFDNPCRNNRGLVRLERFRVGNQCYSCLALSALKMLLSCNDGDTVLQLAAIKLHVRDDDDSAAYNKDNLDEKLEQLTVEMLGFTKVSGCYTMLIPPHMRPDDFRQHIRLQQPKRTAGELGSLWFNWYSSVVIFYEGMCE
jgi:hypothetical protein